MTDAEDTLKEETHRVRPGQTWSCNEAHADALNVPPGHESVSLWADYPQFHGVVDAVIGDVAALVVGTSNSHPRAPDLGDRVDVHVDTLRDQARWSLHSQADTDQEVLET